MLDAGKNKTRITVSAALCALTVFLGYFARRDDFGVFIAIYALFFGLYLFVFFQKNINHHELRWYTRLGIFLRVLLLFSIPNFSDDIYRFLWDGHLIVNGIHPFAHVPAYFIENHMTVPGLTPELFQKLNSPGYHTVYPPVCQAVFALAAWMFPNSIWGGVFVMKLFLLGCELLTIRMLASSGQRQSMLYALNPLIILEISGNCHFEGAMICFLVSGIFALQLGRINKAGIWFALATAAKLLPVLFLPIVWRYLGWRRGWQFFLVFGLTCMLLFAPLLDVQVLQNMASSIDLYFRKFQFNASVYYLLFGIGWWIKGFDTGRWIGPCLGLLTMAGVFILAFFTKPASSSGEKQLDWKEALLWASMLHLSFSSTVHPWYATGPLALGLLTRWRFPILWSGLIAMSYSHYSDGVYLEKYWLIALEYSILWVFIYQEMKGSKWSFANPSSPPR